MNLRGIKIVSFFGVFAFTFLFHFLYEWFPNPVFSIFFPVNESIWEHMKLLYSGFLFWSFIERFLIKKNDIIVSNYTLNLFIVMVTSIIVYLILYLPLYAIFGESMFIAISLLIIVILLEEILSYYLLESNKKNNILNRICIVLILLGYVVFASLTYNPLRNYIFYDTQHNKYGIDIYSKD
ncbi:MAG: hypothetical protein IJL74_03140 [Bacilli bacterium]|nr:hypothetical protein [Bacilli bacterium]